MNITFKKTYEIFCTFILLIGFVYQFLVIQERVGVDNMTWLTSIFKSLSYMTIWTNLILFITFILLTFNKINPNRQSYFSALMTYISIVCVIYHVALAHLWSPQGYLYITDKIFHTVSPVLYLIYWLVFTKKIPVDYIQSFKLLIYPAVYSTFFLILGLATHNYPYPIFNLDTLPFLTVLLNFTYTMITYIVFGVAIIGINNTISKRVKHDIQYQ
jgi:hypothetical protein